MQSLSSSAVDRAEPPDSRWWIEPTGSLYCPGFKYAPVVIIIGWQIRESDWVVTSSGVPCFVVKVSLNGDYFGTVQSDIWKKIHKDFFNILYETEKIANVSIFRCQQYTESKWDFNFISGMVIPLMLFVGLMNTSGLWQFA